MNQILTSYIANVNHVTPAIRAIQHEMGERSFPCCLSNDVEQDIPPWPRCSPMEARRFSTNRILAIKDSDLAFFFLFMSESERNEIAAFEIGLAIQTKATIVLIGPRPKSSIHCIDDGDKQMIRCYDFDNFLSLRFP